MIHENKLEKIYKHEHLTQMNKTLIRTLTYKNVLIELDLNFFSLNLLGLLKMYT